jgi:NADH-quinone oxidoreductase subunit F
MDFAQVRAIVEKECDYLADTSCIKIYIGYSPENSSGDRLFNLLRNEVENTAVAARIIRTGSFGCYDFEPILVVDTPGRSVLLCLNANPEMAREIEADIFAAGMAKRGGEWFLLSVENKEHIPYISNLPLFSLQKRILLRNCGWIDPGSTAHYILGSAGYTGLSRALRKNRRELMELFYSSPFKEYVHAGVSSLDQWSEFVQSESSDKRLVCNAVDPDPGNRLLLESDPHSILEGILISAFTLGTSHCTMYVRSGTRVAANLNKLLGAMETYNLVGSGILDSAFSAQIEVIEIPETLRAGQESESLRCIRQSRAPHILPAFPGADKAMSARVITTDPEWMACIPALLLTDEELRTGFRSSRDGPTRLITLSGKIGRRVTAEVPCGVSIRNTIEDIGGSIISGKAFKALQIGYPAGSLLDPDALDSCIHCRTSGEACSGSASIEIMDSDDDIVEMARIRMETVNDQSCGKCLLCFEGSRQMFHTIERIAGGTGKLRDLDFLTELGEEMKAGCLCSFGRTAPDFVLSSIELFREEYEQRIQSSSCNVQTS